MELTKELSDVIITAIKCLRVIPKDGRIMISSNEALVGDYYHSIADSLEREYYATLHTSPTENDKKPRLIAQFEKQLSIATLLWEGRTWSNYNQYDVAHSALMNIIDSGVPADVAINAVLSILNAVTDREGAVRER